MEIQFYILLIAMYYFILQALCWAVFISCKVVYNILTYTSCIFKNSKYTNKAFHRGSMAWFAGEINILIFSTILYITY